MTLSESELKTLHQLVEQDDALRGRVQAAQTALDVAQILAQAGCAHGLSVTSDALLPHIENAALQSTGKELTEAELTDVAGGKTYTLNFLHFRNEDLPKPYCIFTPPAGSNPGPWQAQLNRDWLLRWNH